MQISDLIAQMGGLQQVASELGVSPQQAQSGAAALLPAILGGFKKQTQAQPAGLEGLGGLLGQLGGGGLLDNVLGAQPTNVDLGNNVLGQIFGNKEVSRTVAASAAAQSGLDPSLLKKMLPILAMMAAGYMAKQHGGGGMAQAAPSAGGGLGGLLGGLLGGGNRAAPQQGGIGSLLDLNGNGNPLDDIIGMAGKLMR
jgi:hypothetical protein